MKKFLSLVLALVMTMSLVTVSAGAKDFTDASSINYDEAVAVVSAAKIVDGYTDGSFGPTTTLTRGAAAKIICNMILGPTTAAALSADSAPYSDVPVNHTFAGYIAYCAQQGIISGYADGTFRPAGTLTGYAFMKMLLGALGYDADVENYVGNNWSINVAKQALNIGLDDGNDEFVGTKAVTREEACLYAFNALKATMVDYSSKVEVNNGDSTVTISGGRYNVGNSTKTDGNIYVGGYTSGKDGLMQFAEKYFSKLESQSATDTMGRPATKWIYDGDTVGTYSDTADETFVASKTDKSLATYLTDTDYIGYDSDDVKGSAEVWVNGAKTGVYSTTSVKNNIVARGSVIEVFESSNKVSRIVITAYTAAKIDDVEDELSSSLTKKDATVELTLKAVNGGSTIGTYYDAYKGDDTKVLAGFDADTYTKGTVLAVVLSNKRGEEGRILESYVAESVEGKVTAYKANDTVTVDGTKYSFMADKVGDTVTCYVDGMTTGFSFEKTYTVYTTADGYVIAVNKNNASIEDAYYVAGLYMEAKTSNVRYYAQAVSLENGEIENIRLEQSVFMSLLVDGAEGKYQYINADGTVNETGKELVGDETMYVVKPEFAVCTFSDDDDDDTTEAGNNKFTAVELDDEDYAWVADALREDVKTDSASVKYGVSDKKNITDDTAFISVEGHGADLEVKTATGGMKAGETTPVIVISEVGSKDALYVIYVDEDLKGIANSDIVYLDANADAKTSVGYTGGGLYYMDGMDYVEGLTFKASRAKGFWKVNSITDKNGTDVYELVALNAENDILAAYTDSADGAVKAATIEKKGYNRDTLTTADVTAFEDVSCASAQIIDVRTAAAKNAALYSSDITSVAKLKSALDKGWVTVDLYVEDGDITFIAVKASEQIDQAAIDAEAVADAVEDIEAMDVEVLAADEVLDEEAALAAVTEMVNEAAGNDVDVEVEVVEESFTAAVNAGDGVEAADGSITVSVTLSKGEASETVEVVFTLLAMQPAD